MNELDFLLNFGALQFEKGGGVGGHCTPKMIIAESGMPRTTIYYHLNNLMDKGLIAKHKHGKYCLAWNRRLVMLSACMITAWEAKQINVARQEGQSQFGVVE